MYKSIVSSFLTLDMKICVIYNCSPNETIQRCVPMVKIVNGIVKCSTTSLNKVDVPNSDTNLDRGLVHECYTMWLDAAPRLDAKKDM